MLQRNDLGAGSACPVRIGETRVAEQILPLLMFVTLLGLMLTGYPIGVILGGVAILFGCIGMAFDLFRMVEFFNLVPRVWFFAENLQLVAVPLLFFGPIYLTSRRPPSFICHGNHSYLIIGNTLSILIQNKLTIGMP